MKWVTVRIVLPVTLAVVTAAALMGAISSTRGQASDGYTIAPGSKIPGEQLGLTSRQRLAALGVDEISVLGANGDRSYYKLRRTTGETCYAAAERTSPPMLLDIGCLSDTEEIPYALIDMSGIVIDPDTGAVVRVAHVEGVAANEVSAVGVEVGGRIAVTTPVRKNVYRFDRDKLPADAGAVVALDATGNVLWRKELR